ncbi:MAG TPA: ATP-binding protein [Terracidiphilus sp.]|jgi:signal transduction histidine kinase
MSLWNPRSIAGKLTRMNILVSGTALLLAYIAFLGYDLYTLRQDLVHSMATEAGIVGANSVTALLFDDQQAAESTLSALAHSPHIRWAVIVDAGGAPFATYQRDASNIPTLRRSLGAGKTLATWTAGTDILLGSRIVFQGRNLGAVYLLAGTGELAHRALQFGLLSALILMLCFAIAVLATSTIRQLVTGPLTELAGTAQRVSKEKDYSVRAPVPSSSDELAWLVQSFNEMLEQIQERDRALESSRTDLELRVRERTAELTEANKELEAFSYSVAHDLRGPLQHVANIAFLLQNASGRDEGQSGRGDGSGLIGKLVEGTDRMAALIDDLLNLSRATSTPLRRVPVDLSRMAESILGSLQAGDRARDVRFTVMAEARAVVDEGLIQLALTNLLHNAWKYTAKVEIAEIQFGLTDNGAGPVYFVRDNGAGFNPQYADRLFRPFQRLHSQSEFPGTGIGLATAQRIIARHGGKIWAEGNVGRGAVFYFTLPYIPEA